MSYCFYIIDYNKRYDGVLSTTLTKKLLNIKWCMQRRRSILNIQLKQLRDKQTRKNTLLKLLPQNVVCDDE